MDNALFQFLDIVDIIFHLNGVILAEPMKACLPCLPAGRDLPFGRLLL